MAITIGIPFYNVEKYIGAAIQSIFAQSYQNWELLLVDDGSTDGSLVIANSIKDPRVRVISDGHHRGLPYRLNQITREAKYDLIGRMDADDIVSPLRFEKELLVLQEQPGIDLVTTGICSLSNKNRPIGFRVNGQRNRITGKNLLQGKSGIAHAAILGRKQWFVRNPYDSSIRLAQDYELWLRAFFKDDLNIYVINEPLYYYREGKNIMAERILSVHDIQRQIFKKYSHIIFSPLEAKFHLAKLHMKSLAIKTLSFANKLDLLLKHRNMMIKDRHLQLQFQDEIGKVLETKVPGLS